MAEGQTAHQWYAERSPQAAAAFLAELDHAMVATTEAPESWPQYLCGTRRFLLRRFPFSVVYYLSDTNIDVVAIAHAHRRPGYWRNR